MKSIGWNREIFKQEIFGGLKCDSSRKVIDFRKRRYALDGSYARNWVRGSHGELAYRGSDRTGVNPHKESDTPRLTLKWFAWFSQGKLKTP